MKPSQSEAELSKRLGDFDLLTPRRAFDAMLDFYEQQRADGVFIDQDGDMLLYEWGVYDFAEPESFQLSITRQFIIPAEDEPFQLKLRLHFEPTDALRQLESGSKWCESPAALPAFRQYIVQSSPFTSLADDRPSRVELRFDQC